MSAFDVTCKALGEYGAWCRRAQEVGAPFPDNAYNTIARAYDELFDARDVCVAVTQGSVGSRAVSLAAKLLRGAA